MSSIAPAFTVVTPNVFIPEIIMPFSQASGAFNTLADGQPLQRISDDAVMAYIRRIDVRTKAAGGQSSYNQLPSVGLAVSLIGAPTYNLRVRAEWDHHDVAAFSRHGVDLQQANSLAMRQSHFQLARNALLYGMNPANGEGLLNAAGATAITLPPDSNGNDTLATYDNGELGFFFLSQITALKSRTNQLGIGRRFVFLGPQRTLGPMEYQNIVSLVQYQRKGSGVQSTKGMLEEVAQGNGDTIEWVYDDTLIGKGANGTDAILIVMPEVETQNVHKIDTNAFAKLQPGLDACTLQLCDMAAPRELPTPLAGGATDCLSEWRITSGWAVRGEAVTILSIQYS
jgi:hypothetical protein